MMFREGDRGTEMYSVLKGRVAIRKGDEEIGVIPAGTCSGEMSFLLRGVQCFSSLPLQ